MSNLLKHHIVLTSKEPFQSTPLLLHMECSNNLANILLKSSDDNGTLWRRGNIGKSVWTELLNWRSCWPRQRKSVNVREWSLNARRQKPSYSRSSSWRRVRDREHKPTGVTSSVCPGRVKLVSFDTQTALLIFQENNIIELSDDVEFPSICTLSPTRMVSYGIRFGKFYRHSRRGRGRGRGRGLNGLRECLSAYHISWPCFLLLW